MSIILIEFITNVVLNNFFDISKHSLKNDNINKIEIVFETI